MTVTLVLCPTDNPSKTPEQMLYVVAGALRMDYSCYKKKTRARDIVDLRFIASHLLRTYFPAITLQQISVLFGGQDHSSVINGLSKTNTLLAISDESFTHKYETALKSVTTWLRKEVSGYASAISA